MMTHPYASASPEEIRKRIRTGAICSPTTGMAAGKVQANLVILPKAEAFDFLIFCQRNPKPCPLLDVTDAGGYVPPLTAPTADIRTDVSKYRIYRNGLVTDEVSDILSHWRNDFAAFLLGCSFTFENALLKAGVPVRNVEHCCNVPMYITNIPCKDAGIFKGPMVVSMRPIPEDRVVKAVQVTSRYPAVHGGPIHIGCPKAIGITDLERPDFGDPVPIHLGEVPVFWACGVTPQAVAMAAKPPLMITHAPGYMFITDLSDEDVAAL